LPVAAVAKRVRKHALPGARFLIGPEVQTFAFAVAAYSVLSFFPFILLLLVFVKHFLHSTSMYNVLLQVLSDNLPAGQDFVIKHLNAMVNARRKAQIGSLLVLLVAAKGVFMPLEIALNRIWRFPRNRSFLGNQLVSVLLAFCCSLLALTSVAMTATGNLVLRSVMSGQGKATLGALTFLSMKLFALAASVGIFFLIYWILPNGPTPARRVLPAAAFAGVLFEIAKFGYISLLRHLTFSEVYGPFALPVTLMIWAFVSALVLLLGGYLSAQK
jgi:membrane protein